MPLPRSPHVVEANGARIPVLGLGTSRVTAGECLRTVEAALGLGYRHIDTAVMYDNEVEIGAALQKASVPRDDLFITTKVLPGDLGAGALQRSAQASLKRLQLDHVDLLLIHWPNAAIPLAASVAALCDAKKRGLTRHIGVANFPVALLDEAVRLAAGHGEKLVANQCEYHPRLDQTKLIAACRKHGAAFVSYCPIGQGGLLADPTIAAVAKKMDRAPAQILLRWHVQQPGVVAIPRSTQFAHLRDNIALFDFALDEADMKAISALARSNGRILSPPGAPAWD